MNALSKPGNAGEAVASGRFRPRVLIVDDEPDFLFILHEILGDGYETMSLPSGDRFFETVFSFSPDLIILDVEMPGADGFVLCRRLKSLERMRDLPVLLLTGRRSDEDFISNLSAGGDAFLTKPVDERVLRRHVVTLLKSY